MSTRGWSRRVGALVVFVLLAVAMAIVAFEAAYADRVLPGVHVGQVDLSGLDRTAASARLARAFESPADGRIELTIADSPQTITYAEVGRRPDVDRMVDEALAVGRTGDLPTRLAAAAGAISGRIALDPRMTFDAQALSERLNRIAAATDKPAVDAGVVAQGVGFTVRPAEQGRVLVVQSVADAIGPRLADPMAPVRQAVDPAYRILDPEVDDQAAEAALAAAERLTADDLVVGVGGDQWTIPSTVVSSWIRFGRNPAGRYVPTVVSDAPHAVVSTLEASVERKPRDATFSVGTSGTIVAGRPSTEGRALDVHGTATAIVNALDAAATGTGRPLTAIGVVVKPIPPRLTSAETERVAPLLTRLSTWTTRYVPSERNGFGANITIPAKAIDGTVVLPGAVFDFWDAVGEVSPEKGYRYGGAIINGRTDPTGALGGGICSTSTTLFNAAARAGLAIVSRTAHYYYIDRYPVGLDATVFISSSGSKVTLAFRNDTSDPIVIRGFSTSTTVRFDIYGVPTGRKVVFSTPIVKSVRKAIDTTEKSSTLPAGSRKRVEYPTDGFDSWVTRTVTDAAGTTIHRDTFYSHYARVDGLTLVGAAPAEASSPRPSSGSTP